MNGTKQGHQDARLQKGFGSISRMPELFAACAVVAAPIGLLDGMMLTDLHSTVRGTQQRMAGVQQRANSTLIAVLLPIKHVVPVVEDSNRLVVLPMLQILKLQLKTLKMRMRILLKKLCRLFLNVLHI